MVTRDINADISVYFPIHFVAKSALFFLNLFAIIFSEIIQKKQLKSEYNDIVNHLALQTLPKSSESNIRILW